jgi:ribosomal protein L4
VNADDAFARTARNIAGISLVAAGRVTPRDLIDTAHVIVTREALEKLQETVR